MKNSNNEIFPYNNKIENVEYNKKKGINLFYK